ncbi:MerR family transcriptional regulator [Clostridium sp. YIM B02515]|uniref:MerR family transcriptional regulator n=1 Tax=Clostridium rhizosphaerae TaxID=2803861 RepID=A0ABS1T4M5_9CLOT|nr:MerR family transcriptional regulator [Clostridium rhizosphaerae]MBL4934196.1 MerR family transcriptional regulator [Clostridium rhizosphaerae]
MKIGKFAQANNLSIDTIRHYMDLGLILPEKQGGQYYFDSRCQKALEQILNLKGLGFNLNEIKIIFFYESFGRLTDYEGYIYYRELFINKHRKVSEEIEQLLQIKDKLNTEIVAMSKKPSEPAFEMGINLKNLELFKCSKCDGSLVLKDGSISNNQIINGTLKCSCGEEYIIESGILKAGNPVETAAVSFNDNYISDYISLTNTSYLDNLHKGLEWSSRKIENLKLNEKILLELGTGTGFFLRNIYNQLPEDCVYIAVDHNLERHKFLKKLIERAPNPKNIIFICSDFLEIPIKERSVDFVLDISGSSNYGFEHEEFLLKSVDSYVKEDAYLLGSFIAFKNFTSNSLIERKYRKNFLIKNIKQEIESIKYKLMEERTSDTADKGGRYESFFVEGERVCSYSFLGKR